MVDVAWPVVVDAPPVVVEPDGVVVVVPSETPPPPIVDVESGLEMAPLLVLPPLHAAASVATLSARTSVVRAVAFTEQVKASPVVTRTCIFVADVVTQSANGRAPRALPS